MKRLEFSHQYWFVLLLLLLLSAYSVCSLTPLIYQGRSRGMEVGSLPGDLPHLHLPSRFPGVELCRPELHRERPRGTAR